MKANIWTFLIALLFISTIIFWIIPAILKWQKNKHEHDERMFDKSAEVKKVDDLTSTPSRKGFKDKATSFFERIFAEIIPALAGKMISGS